jgi:hypothetical protein
MLFSGGPSGERRKYNNRPEAGCSSLIKVMQQFKIQKIMRRHDLILDLNLFIYYKYVKLVFHYIK